jgi:hypothetical protein
MVEAKHMIGEEIAVKAVTVLLAVVAALAAFGVASAGAVEPVEVAVEPRGHVVDGTDVHFIGQGPMTLLAHIPGVGELAASVCQDVEFHGHINEDGSGEFDDVEIFGTGTCTREACREGGGHQEHWPFQIEEDHSTGLEMVHLTWCLEPVGGGEHDICEMEVPLVHDPEDAHHYTITTTDPGATNGVDCATHTPGVTIEVYAAWELDGRALEVVH